jgi:hypothetical protein
MTVNNLVEDLSIERNTLSGGGTFNAVSEERTVKSEVILEDTAE